MSARIVELSRIAAARSAPASPEEEVLQEPPPQQFRFWTGASGERYVHSVFSLIGCPELPGTVYLLVRRDHNGRRRVLRIARTVHEAASLNLAEIRHRGAQLGANEVHVHFLALSERERRRVEHDLRSALFPQLSAEQTSSMRH
mgnify:CR=1 FL=1